MISFARSVIRTLRQVRSGARPQERRGDAGTGSTQAADSNINRHLTGAFFPRRNKHLHEHIMLSPGIGPRTAPLHVRAAVRAAAGSTPRRPRPPDARRAWTGGDPMAARQRPDATGIRGLVQARPVWTSALRTSRHDPGCTPADATMRNRSRKSDCHSAFPRERRPVAPEAARSSAACRSSHAPPSRPSGRQLRPAPNAQTRPRHRGSRHNGRRRRATLSGRP